MVAGIVLVALGMKKTIGDTGDPLKLVPAVAMLGGAVDVPARPRGLPDAQRPHRSTARGWSRPCWSLALIPLATEIPALATLAIVGAGAVALVACRDHALRGAARPHPPRAGARTSFSRGERDPSPREGVRGLRRRGLRPRPRALSAASWSRRWSSRPVSRVLDLAAGTGLLSAALDARGLRRGVGRAVGRHAPAAAGRRWTAARRRSRWTTAPSTPWWWATRGTGSTPTGPPPRCIAC